MSNPSRSVLIEMAKVDRKFTVNIKTITVLTMTESLKRFYKNVF